MQCYEFNIPRSLIRSQQSGVGSLYQPVVGHTCVIIVESRTRHVWCIVTADHPPHHPAAPPTQPRYHGAACLHARRSSTAVLRTMLQTGDGCLRRPRLAGVALINASSRLHLSVPRTITEWVDRRRVSLSRSASTIAGSRQQLPVTKVPVSN